MIAKRWSAWGTGLGFLILAAFAVAGSGRGSPGGAVTALPSSDLRLGQVARLDWPGGTVSDFLASLTAGGLAPRLSADASLAGRRIVVHNQRHTLGDVLADVAIALGARWSTPKAGGLALDSSPSRAAQALLLQAEAQFFRDRVENWVKASALPASEQIPYFMKHQADFGGVPAESGLGALAAESPGKPFAAAIPFSLLSPAQRNAVLGGQVLILPATELSADQRRGLGMFVGRYLVPELIGEHYLPGSASNMPISNLDLVVQATEPDGVMDSHSEIKMSFCGLGIRGHSTHVICFGSGDEHTQVHSVPALLAAMPNTPLSPGQWSAIVRAAPAVGFDGAGLERRLPVSNLPGALLRIGRQSGLDLVSVFNERRYAGPISRLEGRPLSDVLDDVAGIGGLEPMAGHLPLVFRDRQWWLDDAEARL